MQKKRKKRNFWSKSSKKSVVQVSSLKVDISCSNVEISRLKRNSFGLKIAIFSLKAEGAR